MTLEGKKEDGSTYEVPLAHTFNANQLKWFKAGSALNAVRLSLVALTVSWVFLCEAIHRCCAISDLSGVSCSAGMHCLKPLPMAFTDVEGVNVPCRCGSRKPFQGGGGRHYLRFLRLWAGPRLAVRSFGCTASLESCSVGL